MSDTIHSAEHKVDREQVLKRVAELIRESGNLEAEVSAADLAKEFGVQPATMDYHLKRLLDEGELVLSNKRGRYNRKIYRLPATSSFDPLPETDQETTEVITPLDDKDILAKLIKAKEEALGIDIQKKLTIPIQELPIAPEDDDTSEYAPGTGIDYFTPEGKAFNPDVQKLMDEQQSIHFKTDVLSPKQHEFLKGLEERQKSLDEQIRDFQMRNSVTSAEVMLKKDDKEILSVAIESISQFATFLKDLTEQLSTIEDKRFIQALIEDRNENLRKIEELEKENAELQKQVQKSSPKESQDERERRAQLMVQRILHTVDTFVELPSHSMVLSKNDFRKNITKEVMDLYRYGANLDD
jgi:DNA-binding transcriptional ArsR family regulator